MRLKFSLLSVLTAPTSAYTDSETGISFQRFATEANGGFHFAIAFPQNPVVGSEFIGQIMGPINTGYSGVSFGGGMLNNLLLIAWKDGNQVRHSFRFVDAYVEPVIYTGAATATTLHTSFTSTHWKWTFRCQNCATWTGGSGGFDATAAFTVMGWAQASSGTTDPTNSNSAIIQHNNGFGEYGVVLESARFAAYSDWIAGAGPTSTMSTAPTSTTTTSTAVITGIPAPTNTYDYIVVGGGAGGLVAADKLSQSGKSVLLIERGPPSTWATGGRNGPSWANSNSLTRYDVPGLCNQIWVDSVGIACRDVGTMAGCVLGGGTAINAGLFFKPPAQDWDMNFPSGSGWRSSDMTAATNRVFSRIPSTDTPSLDGKRYIQESYTLMSNILGGSGWTAVTANSSPNSKNRTYAHTPFMYINGERGGPLATYYRTAKARSKVRVMLNTMVDRVIRNGTHILGVEVSPVTNEGYKGKINAKYGTGRVVLSAGVFGTAKILFRSGIGPTDQLEIVASSIDGPNMPPKNDWINLPVGYNLMDHTNIDVVISHPSIVPYDFYAAWDNPTPADKTLYLSSRSGPLAGAAPAPNTIAWESIPGSIDGIPRQLQWTARAEGSMGASGDTLVTVSQYLGTGMTSRGRLGISSTLTTSILTAPYLKNEADIQAVIKGLNNFMTAAKKISSVTFIHPTPSQTAEQYVRSYKGGQGSNHWVGSCKMGSNDGRNNNGVSGDVVDFNTKVYGTDNLFVVDASIFPGHVTTNPTAPIMIASERAPPLITIKARYEQCGGINYTGSTWCAQPYVCTFLNPYYFQCL
ncbi:cellobiose dehydrogenase [Kalaharituber pfeilii]|nr:cellobiose dehydrogenase [Kalaharituber pfeilii]